MKVSTVSSRILIPPFPISSNPLSHFISQGKYFNPTQRFAYFNPSGSVPISHRCSSLKSESQDLAQDALHRHISDSNSNEISKLMKMARNQSPQSGNSWFPYIDRFDCTANLWLTSNEVLHAIIPHIMPQRLERFQHVILNRTYSTCLVVEGLADFGNVSAAFRSADALGIQSVHVISTDRNKRYKENRHVSMGAEKWLDIEVWDSTTQCFETLKSRGYRIATTHLSTDAVSVYEMDWSIPTAIVVGNEKLGISEEAIQLADMRCMVPINGMVDSFNVSVASGILLHNAVLDRVRRVGTHGDLKPDDRKILLAEFSLRHSKSSEYIAQEYAKRIRTLN